MSTTARILFATSEVAPFARVSDMADYLRTVPEYLNEQGLFESRIMMPRYGTISERKNRLHEVIRLSGSTVKVGDVTETLKVKVASIPGVRMQVYFTDSVKYFKRKGIYHNRKTEAEFTDNPERAYLFAEAVIDTARKLGWGPKIVHAHGWLASMVPALLKLKYADDPLFADARVIYTTDGVERPDQLTPANVEALGLPDDSRLHTLPVGDLGPAFADLVLHDAALGETPAGATELAEAGDARNEQIASLYSDLVNLQNAA
ncbi:MAG: glycogen/starch synthase [Bacteroidota bacterium]